ncbi:MAG: pyridoxal phosphate-dependent aminotransferase family protein [Proteobacteria bacterium]|nr:pyridoxal phosphate-dependent aminotransferase family protein [Pseudomonadota bacterium]
MTNFLSPSHGHTQGMDYLLDISQRFIEKQKKSYLFRELNQDLSTQTRVMRSDEEWLDYFQTSSTKLAKQLLTITEIPQPLNLNTNDYLGLQRSGATYPFDQELATMLPVGGMSSRLIGGNHQIIKLLENTFANITGFNKCLYMPSGMTLNLGLPIFLHRLAQRGADGAPCDSHLAFFSDELNHASIIEGLRLIPKPQKIIFDHLDVLPLPRSHQWQLAQASLVFLEGRYSMDGDYVARRDLIQLSRNPKTVLVMDEAHCFGVSPDQESIASESLFKKHQLTNIIGVFPMGKAMACSGAFLAGPEALIHCAINLYKPFIYTTAPSPLTSGALLLRLITQSQLDPLKLKLKQVSTLLGEQLMDAGFMVKGCGGPFLCVKIGCEQKCLQVNSHLRNQHIYTTAIRYPTVKPSESCIRLSLHPYLTRQHINLITKSLLDIFSTFL